MSKEEQATISDLSELKTIQDELINRGDGKYVQPLKPHDEKYIKKLQFNF